MRGSIGAFYEYWSTANSNLCISCTKLAFGIASMAYTVFKLANFPFFYQHVNDEFVWYANLLLYLASFGLTIRFILGKAFLLERFLLYCSHLYLFFSFENFTQGGDQYILLFLFYMVLVPEGGSFKKAEYALIEDDVSNIAVNLFKHHLLLTYVVSGLAKLNSDLWVSGLGLWSSVALYNDWNALLDVDPQSPILLLLNQMILYAEIFLPFLLLSRFWKVVFPFFILFHIGIMIVFKLFFFQMINLSLLIILFGFKPKRS